MNQPDSATFAPHRFLIVEDSYDPSAVAANETLFCVANGYIGIRGTFEEGRGAYHHGTYLNGFYETEPIIYGEHAYGFAKNKQRMLNVTEGTMIQLYVDDDPLDLSTGKIIEYRRYLDMEKGCLNRELTWSSPSGKLITIESTRLVSFVREHIAAIRWKCRMHEQGATLTVISGMFGKVKAQVGHEDPRVGTALRQNALIPTGKKIDNVYGSLRHITRNTRFNIVCTMANELTTDSHFATFQQATSQEVSHRFQINANPQSEVTLSKYLCYYSSIASAPKKLSALSMKDVQEARKAGFDRLLAEQAAYLSDFWRTSDVRIEGDPSVQQSVRFNIFHVLQAAGRNSRTNIAAKGLTGEGYEGHYFWDTEIYAVPFFMYTNPNIARHLLEYRYNILDKARERARELDLNGALFPWRTINGEEASAYFPAGTAQYHINADIFYAMRKYWLVTGDTEFMLRCGAEVGIETARFWLDMGDYIPGKGYCFNEVTGPNEYTALVNNNTYTNLMARSNLEQAASVMEWMRDNHPEEFARLQDKTRFEEQEINDWKNAADRVYVPHNRELGLYAQDDSFFDKAVWDFDGTPPDKYPLLLYYHPLTIYRYQVLKQPDVVLAMLLQGDRFSQEEKRRNFDYYDALTTGDSSLSPCVQSIGAAEVGYIDLAYDYFMQTARMDLDDINRNVKDGVHTAAMAGTWLSVVYGFAGLRDYDGRISFRPQLPPEWKGISFRLRVRSSLFEVRIGEQETQYELLEGDPLTIHHGDEEIRLEHGRSASGRHGPRPINGMHSGSPRRNLRRAKA
ncbi:glycoside hydrolase family 65 protein [Salinispira pacifica]